MLQSKATPSGDEPHSSETNAESANDRISKQEAASNMPSEIRSKACSIEVEDAVLEYPVGPYRRGSLKSSLMSLVGFREQQHKFDFVTALKGVSFDINHGERVGVVGRNGSGKSTLLRALAGVYPMRSGSITIHGDIGTLLDISLGFELESTGRENIYNRGMSMGYSRKELEAVEDEIIRFTDIGNFIDLPMRTYSTGMCVRLGFAISTQFIPDILLIDEVFGAGDGIFANRALDRMNAVVESSGIVVLVSHDMNAVKMICNRVLWIDDGEVKMDGPTDDVLAAFSDFVLGISRNEIPYFMPLRG
ncbi:MAG: ABC transporter ATP-binding protein [Pseudomonadota bacterium]